MKRNIFKALAVVALAASLTSCGDDFLETKNYKGVDVDNGLSNASAVANAVNGEYYWLHDYRFAGNFAINIGEIPTDIAYWNAGTDHFNDIYQFTLLIKIITCMVFGNMVIRLLITQHVQSRQQRTCMGLLRKRIR